MFRISAFARLAGVSARMLRAWDELGLFRPVWVDRSNGYRYYSPAQLPELRRILALRDVGVPLAELTELVSGGADLRAILERRRSELERERLEIERRLRALEISVETIPADVTDPAASRIDGIGAADRLRPAWDVVVRPVAAERVATYTLGPMALDLGPAFYELEAYVRDAGRRAPRPPGSIVGSDGHDRTIFVPVTGPIEPRDPIGWRTLPACRAASVIHRGSYEGLAEAQGALVRWVGAASLSPAGAIRILYLQFGAEPELRVPPGYVVERADDFVTEVQLPLA